MFSMLGLSGAIREAWAIWIAAEMKVTNTVNKYYLFIKIKTYKLLNEIFIVVGLLDILDILLLFSLDVTLIFH